LGGAGGDGGGGVWGGGAGCGVVLGVGCGRGGVRPGIRWGGGISPTRNGGQRSGLEGRWGTPIRVNERIGRDIRRGGEQTRPAVAH